MARDINTYTTWNLCYNHRERKRPINCTIGQVKQMCVLLSQELIGYSFVPELITEGGIKIIDWPGKPDRGYKTFRFTSSEGYPWISDDVSEDKSFSLSRHDGVLICLKAFDGAPSFNAIELTAFRRVFEAIIELEEGWRFYKALPKNLKFKE